jgi:hypothetical protein
VYLVWTSHDFGELALLLILAFDNGFNDGGMVGAEVDEDMSDACLPDGLEEGKGCRVPDALSAKWQRLSAVVSLHDVDEEACEL